MIELHSKSRVIKEFLQRNQLVLPELNPLETKDAITPNAPNTSAEKRYMSVQSAKRN